jgi:hypothetical protein
LPSTTAIKPGILRVVPLDLLSFNPIAIIAVAAVLPAALKKSQDTMNAGIEREIVDVGAGAAHFARAYPSRALRGGDRISFELFSALKLLEVRSRVRWMRR